MNLHSAGRIRHSLSMEAKDKITSRSIEVRSPKAEGEGGRGVLVLDEVETFCSGMPVALSSRQL